MVPIDQNDKETGKESRLVDKKLLKFRLEQYKTVPPFGILADILHRSYITYINREFKEDNVNYSHVSLLIFLYIEKDINQEKIANKLRIDKGAVAKGFRKLEKDHFITRVRNDQDRRKYDLALTETGEELVKKSIDINEKWELFVLKDSDPIIFKDQMEEITNNASNLL